MRSGAVGYPVAALFRGRAVSTAAVSETEIGPGAAGAARGGARGILFTAFEPSGDDHASSVIAELRRRHPELPIYAWGGPKMERAGAVIVERTGDDAVMGMPGLAKIIEHKRINARIARWLDANPVALHVPVDSPAANFPICALAKARGIRVVHLVAPQVWAWASWRIKKLRRLTDLVLCLLPFEEAWFLTRGVQAKFIGHPLFDEVIDGEALDRRAAAQPWGGRTGQPRLALMPGSRPKELSGSFPILLDAFRRLRQVFPQAVGVVAATKPEVAAALRERASQLGGWPEGLEMVAGETDAVIRWCEAALVVSGTVTLQVAKQRRPMVTFYRFNRVVYHMLAKWLVSTPYFTLPNLIAGKRIVPELIPYFTRDGEELAMAAVRLLRAPGAMEDQRAELAEVCRRLEGRAAARAAADAIEEMIGLRAM